MGRIALLYVIVLTIPLALGLAAAQTNRCHALKKEMAALTREQEVLLDGNKRLIAEIAGLSSSARIEEVARANLGMDKKEPEDVLQIHIYGRGNGR